MTRKKSPGAQDHRFKGANIYRGVGASPPEVISTVPKGTRRRVPCKECGAAVGEPCVGITGTHQARVVQSNRLLLRERYLLAEEPEPEPDGLICPRCGARVVTRGPAGGSGERRGGTYYRSHVAGGGPARRGSVKCPGSFMEVVDGGTVSPR